MSVDMRMTAHAGSMTYSAQVYSDSSGGEMIDALVFEPGETSKTVYIASSFRSFPTRSFGFIVSAILRVRNSRNGADLTNAFTVTPSYGTVTANKETSYSSSEQVTITIPIQNASALAYNSSVYPLNGNIHNWFKLSLDGGVSFLDRQYITYNGETDNERIIASFPAPLNTTGSGATHYAEVFEVTEIGGATVATAIPGAYKAFVVTTADAAIANYARDAVEAFFRAGIVKGKPGNVFDPKGNATRAEVAAILHRLVQAAAK